MDLIFIPIILIAVLVVITLIIIWADNFFGTAGERSLIVNEEKEIPVTDSDTVLNILTKEKIFIPSACGGKATCGFCKVRVTEGGGDVRPTEEPFLDKEQKANNVRLSCQVKVRENIKVEIPKSLLGALEYKAKAIKVEDLTYDTKLVRFKLIEPDTMEFKPGQYAQIKVPGIEIIRAYSIASDPNDPHHIEFIIRLVPGGLATTFVHKALLAGDDIIITGPYGDFFLREDSKRDMVCIAGGSGKAPIRSILYRLQDMGMPRKVRYFFGAKAVKDLYYTEEMQAIAKEFPNFEYIPALSHPEEEDHWKGETGLITDVLDRMTGDLSESEAYLCGSPGMIDACIKVLKKHDIKDENILYDKFG